MCRDRRRHYDDGFMRVVADLIRGGAGTSAPAPAQGGRTGEKHVLPSSVASGRRDPAGHRADGRRDIRAHAQRVRPPADTHVPRARVRGAGEPQERAEGHEAHGPGMPDTQAEPVPEIQLVVFRQVGVSCLVMYFFRV